MITTMEMKDEQFHILGPDFLNSILHEVAEILPSQGPIDVFIHHNTLHGLEHLSFPEALEEGARLFEARPYLDESNYIRYFYDKRINKENLSLVIRRLYENTEQIDDIINILLSTPGAETLQQVKWLLRESNFKVPTDDGILLSAKAWLSSPLIQQKINELAKINPHAAAGLRTLVVHTKDLNQRYDIIKEALWTRCLLVFADGHINAPEAERIATLPQSQELVNSFLIRFCEEYLDLGQAAVQMPDRQFGMLNCFFNLVAGAKSSLPAWMKDLPKIISSYRHLTAEQIILSIINESKLSIETATEIIFNEALALKGWAGFVNLSEKEPKNLHGFDNNIKPRLIDYIAIRLILSQTADKFITQEKHAPSKEHNLNSSLMDRYYHQAFHLFNYVLLAGNIKTAIEDTTYLTIQQNALKHWPKIRRQKTWHLAYEENLYEKTFAALENSNSSSASKKISAQMIFCLDDREESLRRYVEQTDNTIETFGTAGFFGVDAIYQPFSGDQAPYCPVNIRPKHIIRDTAKSAHQPRLQHLQKRQSLNMKINHQLSRHHDSVLQSWSLTLLGTLSLFPMLFSILWPSLRRPFSKFFDLDGSLTNSLSDLEIDFTEQDAESSQQNGYTTAEMSERVAAVLQTIGLTNNFSKIILVFGHGSSSRNNPLRSAYDCGACGGRPGRMNARAFAKMFNKKAVRELLAKNFNIIIPNDTQCIGAYHNTCTDEIQYFDSELVSDSNLSFFNLLKSKLETACQNNSLERCRRFAQIDVSSSQAAIREVHSRSQTLAEPRPEYGHATNAICLVGKRENNKNIFFDRRAFLVSYDYESDTSATILSNILKAVVPVCGGINLEYFFSALDNEVYGAGSKLPHNIVSMLGLMNGTSSDLRTGLPIQMVEIHEPVRLLIVVECTIEQMKLAIKSDPTVKRMVSGQWVRIACKDKSNDFFWDLAPDGSWAKRKSILPAPPLINNLSEYVSSSQDNLDFVRLA